MSAGSFLETAAGNQAYDIKVIAFHKKSKRDWCWLRYMQLVLFYCVMFNIFKCNRNFRNMLDKYLLSICTALNKINVFCKSQLISIRNKKVEDCGSCSRMTPSCDSPFGPKCIHLETWFQGHIYISVPSRPGNRSVDCRWKCCLAWTDIHISSIIYKLPFFSIMNNC